MTSPSYDFFLICLPGLEDYALKELELKRDLYEQELFHLKKTSGGIEFSTHEITQGFNVNHYSRIGTRLLLRIDQFKARDFPKLFNKLKKINWNEYISGSTPDLVFHAQNSKIFDERKAKKCLHDAMEVVFAANAPKKKYLENPWQTNPKVYMRFMDDTCTLSIDTTGERIDKRGHKLLSAKAPIRESIAAAMCLHNKELMSKQLHFSKFKSVVDPMCGSGTLLLEYPNCFDINYDRYFLYQDFPKIQLKKIRVENQQDFKILGRDLSAENIENAKKNAINSSIENFDFNEVDLFKNNEDYSQSLVVINPPYNKRIKVETNIHNFINRVIEHLVQKNQARLISLVMPETFKLEVPKNMKLIVSKSINNGGINVKFFTLYSV